jgi:hypothetical protein
MASAFVGFVVLTLILLIGSYIPKHCIVPQNFVKKINQISLLITLVNFNKSGF